VAGDSLREQDREIRWYDRQPRAAGVASIHAVVPQAREEAQKKRTETIKYSHWQVYNSYTVLHQG
jgi:hypothetical protein